MIYTRSFKVNVSKPVGTTGVGYTLVSRSTMTTIEYDEPGKGKSGTVYCSTVYRTPGGSTVNLDIGYAFSYKDNKNNWPYNTIYYANGKYYKDKDLKQPFVPDGWLSNYMV